jgi:hypothetical protein
MDYVLGEWEVREGDAAAGFARFSKAAMDCVIVEDWAGFDGSGARAVLFYNARAQVWQIISVSPGGVLDAREQEPGLFRSATTKRRYVREAEGWAMEETANGQTRRQFYRKSASPLPSAVPAKSRCEAPEYREFDFWVGEWEVVTPRGERAGSDSVQKAANGCVLVENWTGVKLNTAISLNFWDPQRRLWRQAWLGPTGLLEFEEQWKNGAIRLKGNTSPTHSAAADTSEGTDQMNRITFTPLGDGSVHENWERSTDGGKTWRPSFVATYRRVQ